jgi:DNA topoisomerase-1
MKTRSPISGRGDGSASVAAAKRAKLRYVSDESPGIKRIHHHGGFRYRDARGKIITDPRVLERIKKLAVPPAWTDVWICPNPNGHLQATGRDKRGRKQYRYHERWRAIRDEHKFDRLIAFGKALPRIRRRVRRDLKLPGLPRAKVLGTVVQLLESTLMRVGNEEYTRQNGSFGLTTLRDSHARVRKNEIRLEFRGKGGIWHRLSVHDRRLARIVKRCQEIPGQDLFQYLDEHGRRHRIGSADVNRYLQEASGGEYTAKVFRTWNGTLLALQAFRECTCQHARPSKRNLKQCIDDVARQLGNTPAVCRKSYVHPELMAAFLDGSLDQWSRRQIKPSKSTSRLRADEAALLAWLQSAKNGKSR